MHEWVEAKRRGDNEWVDGMLTVDNPEQVPRVIVGGIPYGPDSEVSIRVGEIAVPPVLLDMAKRAGFQVEES